MGDRIGVQSNVITTNDDYTGLEFRIWIPVNHHNQVVFNEAINNQLVATNAYSLPPRVPAYKHTSEAYIGDPARRPQLQELQDKAHFSDPVTLDRTSDEPKIPSKRTGTVLAKTIPENDLPQNSNFQKTRANDGDHEDNRGQAPIKWQELVQGQRRQSVQPNYDQVAININNLAQNLRDKLKNLRPASDCVCIYRVPDQLRDLNEKAYTPHIVSIGPFHHGKEQLATMEDEKKRYLQHFLDRNNVTIEELFKATLEIESRLRDSYAGTIEFSCQDFVTMMILDGCFILEYLLKRHFRDWEVNDPVFNKQRMTNIIRFDLLLLENQIPFFYLDQLLMLSNKPEVRRGSVSMVKLVRRFLEESTGWDWLAKDVNEDQETNVQHILHFLSICLLPPGLPRQGKVFEIQASPSIVELHSAGIRFKSSSNRHFLDIQFKNGILDIPTWKINDQIEVLF